MKVLFIAAALALSGCAGFSSVPTSPGQVANQTTLDERLGTGATLAYTAASNLGRMLATAELIDKTKFKALDNTGYAAVLRVRAAYEAANSANYLTAIAEVQRVVTDINSLAKK